MRIKGRFEMDSGSSIAQNFSISGESVGVFIGKYVMIAPNVFIVAFIHGFEDLQTPMINYMKNEAAIYMNDNFWIGSNCNVAKVVRIGEGSFIGANCFVNKAVPAYSIVGVVPAKLIKTRM